MPTINDAAKRAGVAPITVSRVINYSGYFSEGTRQRVEAAVAEPGNVPNRLALGLRTKRTNALALVMTDITNPIFMTITRGVDTVGRSETISLIGSRRGTDGVPIWPQHFLAG